MHFLPYSIHFLPYSIQVQNVQKLLYILNTVLILANPDICFHNGMVITRGKSITLEDNCSVCECRGYNDLLCNNDACVWPTPSRPPASKYSIFFLILEDLLNFISKAYHKKNIKFIYLTQFYFYVSKCGHKCLHLHVCIHQRTKFIKYIIFFIKRINKNADFK